MKQGSATRWGLKYEQRLYRCLRCGHLHMIGTNHEGDTYSACPSCRCYPDPNTIYGHQRFVKPGSKFIVQFRITMAGYNPNARKLHWEGSTEKYMHYNHNDEWLRTTKDNTVPDSQTSDDDYAVYDSYEDALDAIKGLWPSRGGAQVPVLWRIRMIKTQDEENETSHYSEAWERRQAKLKTEEEARNNNDY